MQEEIIALCDILFEYRQRIKESVRLERKKRKFEPAKVELKQQIAAFVYNIRNGDDALSFIKPAVANFVFNDSSSRPSSSTFRPGSALMRQKNPLILTTRSSVSASGSQVSDTSPEINVSHLASAEAIGNLRAELLRENQEMLLEVEYLHADLHEEIEYEARIKRAEPSLEELMEAKMILEQKFIEQEPINRTVRIEKDSIQSKTKRVPKIRQRLLDAKLFGLD